jgi:hypothetical protein
MIISRWILLRMRNVSDKRYREIKTHILCSTTFSRKPCHLWDNVEKYGKSQTCHGWQYNTAHAQCMLDNQRYRHILKIHNTAFPLQQWLGELPSLSRCTYLPSGSVHMYDRPRSAPTEIWTWDLVSATHLTVIFRPSVRLIWHCGWYRSTKQPQYWCHSCSHTIMLDSNVIYLSHLDCSFGWFRTKKKTDSWPQNVFHIFAFECRCLAAGRKRTVSLSLSLSLFLTCLWTDIDFRWTVCHSEEPILYFDMRILEKDFQSPRHWFLIDCSLILLFNFNRIWFS